MIGFLKKLAGKLPLKKLTTNQTFDLIFDSIMAFYILYVLILIDLGPSKDILRPILVLSVPVVIIWSFATNRE